MIELKIKNTMKGDCSMPNTINAIINLVSDTQLELCDYYNTRHRANGEGDSLEEYVKDIYAGTLRETNE